MLTPPTRTSLLAAAVTLHLTVAPWPAAAAPDCARPLCNGATLAADCLFILQAAVGLRQCEPCVCDVDGSGVLAAGDALACLDIAVGGTTPRVCPPCDGPPSTSTTTTK